MVAQQDVWEEIKTQKANDALAELVERANREADARHAQPKPVRLWRAVYRYSGNNNAGNIRGRDGEFMSFATPAEGVAALKADIMAKIAGDSRMMRARYGSGYQASIERIITVYAPPHENDTAHYIKFVAEKSGIHPQRKLTLADANRIIKPMIILEKGHQEARNYIKFINN